MRNFDLVPVLLATIVLVFLFGVGYLISIDSTRQAARQERAYNTCIASGKQYISGSCVE